MTDQHHDDQNHGHPLVNISGGHRANDVLQGHLGRLSYQPLELDIAGVGELRTSRLAESGPRLRETLLLEECYPPTASQPPKPSVPAWQSARSQKNWLLKHHPEAFLGNPSLASILPAEKAEQTEAAQARSALSLLAVGKITDAHRLFGTSVCPAIATAVGEAGHILRLATLRREEFALDDHDETLVGLTTLENGEEGYWYQDVVPLTQIKFAIHSDKYQETRWLLVQNETSTSILEPELRREPAPVQLWEEKLPLRGPSRIAIKPMLTLTIDDTGGRVHSDVCLSYATDGRPSIMAIVDQGGYWTVWELRGRRGPRDGGLRAILRKSGYLGSDPISGPPSSASAHYKQHRAAWISHGKPPSGRGPEMGTLLDHSPARYPDEGQGLRTSELLISCSPTAIYIVDVDGVHPRPGFSLSAQKKPDPILDMHVCPADLSTVFILTTTRLFWIGIGSSDEVRPAVLLSCPHWRGVLDDSIRLGVALDTDGRGGETSCVFLYSSRNLLVDIFWFTNAENAQFRHQTVQAKTLSIPLRIQTLAILCTEATSKPTISSRETGTVAADDDMRFYQLLAVGQDLSLHMSLYAEFSQRHDPSLRRIVKKARSARVTQREALLRYFENSFVVPDDFIGSESYSLRGRAVVPRISAEAVIPTTKPLVIDIAAFVRRFFNDALTEGVDDEAADTDDEIGLESVRDEIDAGILNRDLPFGTLLELATRLQAPATSNTASQWMNYLGSLREPSGERMSILELGLNFQVNDVAQLCERLSGLWSGGLSGHHVAEETRRRRLRVIKQIAMEVFLSQFGVLVPEADATLTPLSAGYEEALQDRLTLPGPRPQSSEVSSRTSSGLSSSQERQTADKQGEIEPVQDHAVSRLKKYVTSLKAPSSRQHGQSHLLSHWPEQRGSDPWQYSWAPDWARREEEEDIRQRRQREEARRQRRAEKRSALLGESHNLQLHSQPLPTIAFSSQVRDGPSQQSQASMSSQALAHAMSQPAAGPHGGRPPKSRKKSKTPGRKGGFR